MVQLSVDEFEKLLITGEQKESSESGDKTLLEKIEEQKKLLKPFVKKKNPRGGGVFRLSKDVNRFRSIQDELHRQAREEEKRREEDRRVNRQILQEIKIMNSRLSKEEHEIDGIKGMGEPSVIHQDYESAKTWYIWWCEDYKSKNEGLMKRGFRARTIERLIANHKYEDPSKLVDKLIRDFN